MLSVEGVKLPPIMLGIFKTLVMKKVVDVLRNHPYEVPRSGSTKHNVDRGNIRSGGSDVTLEFFHDFTLQEYPVLKAPRVLCVI